MNPADIVKGKVEAGPQRSFQSLGEPACESGLAAVDESVPICGKRVQRCRERLGVAG